MLKPYHHPISNVHLYVFFGHVVSYSYMCVLQNCYQCFRLICLNILHYDRCSLIDRYLFQLVSIFFFNVIVDELEKQITGLKYIASIFSGIPTNFVEYI